MGQLRRTAAALAAPALILGLAACSGDGEVPETTEDPAVEDTEQDPAEEDEDGAAEDADRSEGSDETDSTDDAEQPTEGEETEGGGEGSDDPGDSGEPADDDEAASGDSGSGTVVDGIWADDSWTIEDREDDPCSFSIAASPYTESEHVFMCGATADGAIACAIETDETVVCLSDVTDKKAMRFQSSAAAPQGEPPAPEQKSAPLRVELADGAVCTPAAHDMGEHFEGMSSWYGCDDGSELLTEEGNELGDTVERGDTWTAQKSVDGGEPETVEVATASFADPQA